MQKTINVFWFRRDLRLEDNCGLYHALSSGNPVLALFIFDTDILSLLDNKQDARVEFIHRTLEGLNRQLEQTGSSLLVMHGKPEEVWQTLCSNYNIDTVFCNADYEPYANGRDSLVQSLLELKGSKFRTFKDHVLMAPGEVLKDDGKPYTVFTPYSRKWKSLIGPETFRHYPSEDLCGNFLDCKHPDMPSLEKLGFSESGLEFPESVVKESLIRHYAERRNFPAQDACSRLGMHFRFGTISIRAKAGKAMSLSETWINELIWRDFYIQIMAAFPYAMQSAFKPEYERIAWRNDIMEFRLWCKGMTGYPIVDAGMRELNATGYMHNRVRMIVASFLCKHLLIDWRWGEAYFAEKLLDFELASNNGGWQWAAGSGVDAAPYFRIFNPELQTKKFDPELSYVKHWVPEFGTLHYPPPIVDHNYARARCLDVYKRALNPA